MRIPRLVRAAAAAVLALLLAMSACGGKKVPAAVAFPDSLEGDELIATVNGQPVTAHDLLVYTVIYQPASRDSLTDRMYNLELLNGYIDRALLLQEAQAVGVVVDDSTQNWYISSFIRTMGGPERVQGYLAAEGVTRGELESTIRRDLTVRAFIEDRLGAGIQVTEADAQAYYAGNPSYFTTKDSVRARHIIVRTSPDDPDSVRAAKREKIEDVLARVRKGADFAVLARRFSEGPSARNGGDLGYFARDGMVKEFSDAAFALQPGQISDVVETQFGFHIIKVEARTKSRKISFEEARDRIIEGLQEWALSSELENHLKRSRSVAIIEPNFDFGGLTQRESTTFTR